jgi:hypothetical protein
MSLKLRCYVALQLLIYIHGVCHEQHYLSGRLDRYRPCDPELCWRRLSKPGKLCTMAARKLAALNMTYQQEMCSRKLPVTPQRS